MLDVFFARGGSRVRERDGADLSRFVAGSGVCMHT